jgi:hypothetical protein
VNKINSKKLHFLIPGIISALVIVVGYILINGLPLTNIPEIEDVSYVEITDARLDTDTRAFTETEDIENALNVTGLLLYKPGKVEQQESPKNPVIELIFYLKDGTTLVIAADEQTVSIDGKEHNLKGDNGTTFLHVTEGIFFFDALVELEENE